MAATATLPTLSQVQTLDTAYLRGAAEYWTRTANLWEQAFADVHDTMSIPGGSPWKGRAAAAAQERSHLDLVKVREASDQLHGAAGLALRGDQQLQACKDGVLEAVNDARVDGFHVGEDYSVTDRLRGGTPEFRAARLAAAQGHASFIRHRLAALLTSDQQLTTRITAATKDIDVLNFHEGSGVQAVDRHTFKDAPNPEPDPPPPPARGLPPDGVHPPVEGNLTVGPASRPSEEAKGGLSLWDDKGGEWRYDPGANQWHNPHWDYNPHDTKFSQWQNIPMGELPPHTAKAAPKAPVPGPAPSPASKPQPAPRPAPPPVEAPPARPVPPESGGMPIIPGGPATPLGPHVIHPPHSIPHHFPILGEDDPAEGARDFE
ncbi:MAG TPA: hypothetical protein VFI55_01395 [Mycobacterium sp.]|nr:hypothetical protein [Mycobacterium sp.]